MTRFDNRLYLYKGPATYLLGEDEHPPLRIDLLHRIDLECAAALAKIAFSLNEPPPMCWDDSAGWLELPRPLVPTIFRNATDFLDALPGIQAWINSWSASDARAPDLFPDWAMVRNTAPETVDRFSNAIQSNLSGPKRRSICFVYADGRDAVLNIPSRAALCLPPAPIASTSVLIVERKEEAITLILQTGREVLALIDALPSMPSTGSWRLCIDC